MQNNETLEAKCLYKSKIDAGVVKVPTALDYGAGLWKCANVCDGYNLGCDSYKLTPKLKHTPGYKAWYNGK